MWNALRSIVASIVLALAAAGVLCSQASAGEISPRGHPPQAAPGSIQEVKIYTCPYDAECKVQINVSSKENRDYGSNCTITLSRVGHPKETFFYIDRNMNLAKGQKISWTLKIDEADSGREALFRKDAGLRITEGKAVVEIDSETMQVRRVERIMDRSVLLYDVNVYIIDSNSKKVFKRCDTFGPGIINRG